METLRIRAVTHLCRHLRTRPKELEHLCATVDHRYWRHSVIGKGGKNRDFATPTGRLRVILNNLKELLERVNLPECVHGSRRGRSYETNAQPHLNQPTLLKTDIANFFPSIDSGRVYDTFVMQLECSPDVAHYITRLVTHKGSVPLGSPTSPLVAALVARSLSRRIERLAAQRGAVATQYVDDVAVSGHRAGRMKERLETIIRQEGFSVHPRKTQVLGEADERTVTGVRVDRGRDVPRQKIREVRRRIEELERICERGGQTDLATIRSIEGQLHYIGRLNRGVAKHYRKRLRRVQLWPCPIFQPNN